MTLNEPINLLLAGLLLGILMLLFSIWFIRSRSDPAQPEEEHAQPSSPWLSMLLWTHVGIAGLMTVLLALHTVGTFPFTLSTLFIAPVLAMTLILDLRLWRTYARERSQLFTLLLILGYSTLVILIGAPTFLLSILGLCLSAAVVWTLLDQLAPLPLMAAAVLLGAWAFLGRQAFFIEALSALPGWLRTAYSSLTILRVFLMGFVPAYLVYTVFKESPVRWRRAWVFGLAALALLIMNITLTARQAGWAASQAGEQAADSYPFLLLLATLLGGTLMTFSLPERARISGPVYVILVSFVLILTFNQGWKAASPAVSPVPVPVERLLEPSAGRLDPAPAPALNDRQHF